MNPATQGNVIPFSLRRSSADDIRADTELARVPLERRTRPVVSALILLAADIVGVVLAMAAVMLGEYSVVDTLIATSQVNVWGGFALLIGVCVAIRMYPGIGLMPAEELWRLSTTTSALFLGVAVAILSALGQEPRTLMGATIAAWGIALVSVPLLRSLARSAFARRPWWGHGAIVLGAGPAGEEVVRALKRQPALGLKPHVLLTRHPEKHGRVVEEIPVVGGLHLAPKFAESHGASHVIVALADFPRASIPAVIQKYCRQFPRQILTADAVGLSGVWMTGRTLGDLSAVEIQQHLFLPGARIAKRAMDLILVAMLCLPALVLATIFGILIKLETDGPVIYKHERIGQGGRRFLAWKFRTMVSKADDVLQRYLEQHPELKEEWERHHKLRRDPRITSVGSLLRRMSLDELPQLWNVIRGEMSLTGPRPIVEQEAFRYGDRLEDYLQVKPGISGLWQVSGRNDLEYTERVALDIYYVRNWSAWLDLYILIRTPLAVLMGRGAY